MSVFRVGLTRDFLTASGEIAFGDIGLKELKEARGVNWEFLPQFSPEVSPEQIKGYDAILSLAPRYTESTFNDETAQLSVLARFGVGYDNVDVPALTRHNAILTITPDGVRRPVAVSVLTLLLALSHELIAKDRLVRERRWADRIQIKATGLTGRVFGSVGIGNIGAEVFRLLKPLGMVHLACDPFAKLETLAELGVRQVDLETLLRESDFVSVSCPLTASTRGMIGEQELAWMKPSAFFINTSRGPIVDQKALYRALKERRIRAAGLDVFEVEPIPSDEPLLELDNVILTPHSLCWTDECFRLMGESAVRSVLTVLKGEVPNTVVNSEVLNQPKMLAKLESNREKWQLAQAR